jgi:hypothetical protein
VRIKDNAPAFEITSAPPKAPKGKKKAAGPRLDKEPEAPEAQA